MRILVLLRCTQGNFHLHKKKKLSDTLTSNKSNVEEKKGLSDTQKFSELTSFHFFPKIKTFDDILALNEADMQT